MNILGISCFYSDSAAVVIRDGEIIAAVQEERFTRRKHDSRFPINAISWCLKEAGISVKDLNEVVFYEKPFLKLQRFIKTALAYAPSGVSQFVRVMSLWLEQKFLIPPIVHKKIGYRGRITFVGHHESHAASAFYPSPFQEAAIFIMDGVGERETISFGVGKGNELSLQYSLRFPHSLGFLYSAFTYYIGFRVNSGEYKLMGLASFGVPKYADLIFKELLDLKEDGSFKLNMKYFGFCDSAKLINHSFEKLFGGPAREPESEITQKDMDIAASIQKVIEEIILRIAGFVHKVTGQNKLCLAGGVSFNCVATGRLLREGPFKEIWIQPASGDAGAALGAALLVWHKYQGNKRTTDGISDRQKGSFLGPEYSDDQIGVYLDGAGAVYRKVSASHIPGLIADLISSGKIVGWFQGRMEFGPRGLGHRSILGDSRDAGMQAKLNLEIKHREPFRPFAPTVLIDKASEWFELNVPSPYMLLVAPAKSKEIPAVVHIDGTSRVQTVKKADNPLYYDMINSFYKKTGCPVIINTSFNVRGEPIVCAPQDAMRCFLRTKIDYLLMGPYLLDKLEQKIPQEDANWPEILGSD